MANHLKLTRILLEIGGDGTLVIFSDGESIAFEIGEVPLIVSWLANEQRKAVLPLGQRYWRVHEGYLQIREWPRIFTVPLSDMGKICNWLRQAHADTQAINEAE